MTAAAFASMGQALAESIMTDTVTISRASGYSAPDPAGVVTPVMTPVYEGKCRLKSTARAAGSTGVTAGEARDSLTQYVLSVPISVTTVRPGDIARVADSLDPQAPTGAYRVVGVERGSQVTARRFTCELVEER